jgi:ketosteroid isomerase-like protein
LRLFRFAFKGIADVMRTAVLALTLSLASALTLAHAGPTKEAPIPAENLALGEATKVVDAFHAALKKGDKAAVQTLLDDNVEIFEQGAVEHSKAEYVANHLPDDIAFSGATKFTRVSHGGAMLGNLAYFTSENTVTGTFKGQAVNRIAIETMVLHRVAKGWKILHIHWSSRDPDKAAK